MRYEEAGVHIEAKAEALKRAKEAIVATYTPKVLRGIGAFGGLFDAGGLKEMKEPVLVATTDGVGTKTLLALQVGNVSGLGFDLVNHSVNDLLAQGALPLFFMDYLAASRLEEEVLSALLTSLAEACKALGIPLLGGETAEMPGVYREGAWDVVGTLVGVVEKEEILGPERVREGDLLLALPSSGPHTNGYSLIRKAVEGLDLEAPVPELGESLKEALLRPHRAYLKEFLTLRIKAQDAEVLAYTPSLARFLDQALSLGQASPQALANWLLADVAGLLNERGLSLEETRLTPEGLSRLVALFERGEITSRVAKELLPEVLEGQDPETLVRERGLRVVADEGALRAVVTEVIAAMPEAAESVRQGKLKALDALLGQVMRRTKGQAKPDLVRRLLLEALGVG